MSMTLEEIKSADIEQLAIDLHFQINGLVFLKDAGYSVILAGYANVFKFGRRSFIMQPRISRASSMLHGGMPKSAARKMSKGF